MNKLENSSTPIRESQSAGTRPAPETILARGIRLRCPRCGRGKLFRGWFRMNAACPECGLDIHREPGFYLGSMYVNYGLTALITTAVFMVARFHFRVTGATLMWPLTAFCVLFPIAIFRHARSLWLAIDCVFDQESLTREPNQRAG